MRICDRVTGFDHQPCYHVPDRKTNCEFVFEPVLKLVVADTTSFFFIYHWLYKVIQPPHYEATATAMVYLNFLTLFMLLLFPQFLCLFFQLLYTRSQSSSVLHPTRLMR